MKRSPSRKLLVVAVGVLAAVVVGALGATRAFADEPPPGNDRCIDFMHDGQIIRAC